MNEPLTEDTFLLYCMKHYDGGALATLEDFHDDLNRIKYIKKLVTRYQQNGLLKDRLILNHIIVLNNMFSAEVTARMLYFKMKDDFSIIKPFLVTIGIMPERFINVGELNNNIDSDTIPLDWKVVEALRSI